MLRERPRRWLSRGRLNPALGELVAKMWSHPTMKEVFSHRSEFQLNDSAEFYFENIARLSADDYLPTVDDVLRSRVRTTGIVQSEFQIKGLNFCMCAAEPTACVSHAPPRPSHRRHYSTTRHRVTTPQAEGSPRDLACIQVRRGRPAQREA